MGWGRPLLVLFLASNHLVGLMSVFCFSRTKVPPSFGERVAICHLIETHLYLGMNWRQTCLYGILLLAVIWGGVFALTQVARAQKMTVEKIGVTMQKVDFPGLTAVERALFLEKLAAQINRLEWEERQKLQAQRPLEPLIREMTEEERLVLLEKTLPAGFGQLMESLNKMTPQKRQQFVRKGMNDLNEARARFETAGEADGGLTMREFPEETVQKFVQQGFQSYLEDASAETKMDLAPLLEQIQINLQGIRER